MKKITKKNLTKEQREKLEEALKIVEKCIVHYMNCVDGNADFMCFLLKRYCVGIKFMKAFKSTRPKKMWGEITWYKQYEVKPRLDHMNRIKNEILKYL